MKTNTTAEEIRKAYENRTVTEDDPYRLRLHLMPPVGWMNDPNGLCQKDGTYHIFYQFSPQSVWGGNKAWGHYTTTDFLHYTDCGIALYPDTDPDRDGVYSGSAITKDDTMHIFYTGNVMEEGSHDYVHTGRGHTVMHVTSRDGFSFSAKHCVFTNADYPKECTCHVRDPKVEKIGDRYYMVLGARTKDDKGKILLYESTDLETFVYCGDFHTEYPFGYMWECPGLVNLEGNLFLLLSPQGIPAETYRYQNVHNNGYFTVKGTIPTAQCVKEFTELDIGFDFYAPQTFTDEKGRTLLIGWMGLGDTDYTNPTTAYGWQHALTLPRQLKVVNGKLTQTVIEELTELRTSKRYCPAKEICQPADNVFELEIPVTKESFSLQLRRDVTITQDHGVFTLSMGKSGYGRTVRQVPVESLRNLRVFSDTSSLEIFLNDGEVACTTRIYDPDTTIVCSEGYTIYTYDAINLKKM